VKVAGSKVLIKGAVAQHVIDGGEDRSGNSADGLLGPTAMAQALELGLRARLAINASLRGWCGPAVVTGEGHPSTSFL
jgi:hypothetical protein